MKIDFAITELFVGGAERCLTELAIGLNAAGDDVRVFSIGSLPTGERSLLVDRLRANGIDVRSANADSPWQFVRAHRELVGWLSERRPEVCQTFLFHANTLGTFAAKSAGVPIRVGGLRVAESNRLRCAVERRAVRSMTSLVCVSEAVQVFASEQLKCPIEKSISIDNGVDVTRFSVGDCFDWTTLGWHRQSCVTLFVGRLHPQKGIELLREQVDAIAPACSDRKLLIVGDGPLQRSLDRWCEQIGTTRVQRMPWQLDIAPLMRACRMLVLPSRYEGMPNVVMEAMAAARPVVCSRAEGARELLAHHWASQTFEVGDGRAMVERIDAFAADESLASQTGQINQSRMRNEFSIAAMVDAYRAHYRLLNTRRLEV